MNHLTRAVHKELLEEDYLVKNSRKVRAAWDEIAAANAEMVKPALVGELANRIPMTKVSSKCFEFDREYSRYIAAALIVNIMLDSKEVKLRSEGKAVVKPNGRRVVIPQHFVVLGGERTKKDLLRGLSSMPGVVSQTHVGNYKLKPETKVLMSKLSSMPFKVSHIATRELVMKGYQLSKDYHSDSKWCGTAKRAWYKSLVDIFMEVKEMPEFYLPVKFDSRFRLYYFLQFLGLRPQGKSWEVCMIDRADPVYLDDRAVQHVKHIIYVLRYGRTTMADALIKYTDADTQWAKDQNPLDEDLVFDGTRKPLDKFGDRILANKAYEALELHRCGFPCCFMFGKDLTNSGLLMAGASFKSEEMMKAANLVDTGVVHDSHTDFGNGYDLPLDRKEVKDIHMGLLHGSTNKTICKMIHTAMGETCKVTEDDVHTYNHTAYGECVDNIDTIATWGSQLVDNHQTQLRWTTPDGLPATHKATMRHVPLEIYAASASHKHSYSKDVIVGEFPIALDARGYTTFATGYGAGVYSDKGVEISNRGLYANLTHSFDAYLLRLVITRLLAKGEVFLLKHDDYIVSPTEFDPITEVGQQFFTELHHKNYYQSALDEIAVNSKGRAKYVPQLVIGKAENTANTALNWMMP